MQKKVNWETSFNISLSEERNHLLMNPADLLDLELEAGSLVGINGVNKVAASVWPDCDQPRFAIRIPRYMWINIEPVPSKVTLYSEQTVLFPCTRIIVESPKPLPLELIKANLVSICYLFPNTVIPIEFFGNILNLRIIRLEPDHAQESCVYPFALQILSTTVVQVEQSDCTLINTVTFDDVGGLHKELQQIRNTAEMALIHPERFKKVGIRPPKGILLHGPSGVGKTLIARALLNEVTTQSITVKGSEVLSGYYGESESKLRQLFDTACQKSPCVVFFDEIEALCSNRDYSEAESDKRLVTTLLTLLDGLDHLNNNSRVLVVATTSSLDSIDSALRRPGRFDKEIEIGIPTSEQRLDILVKLLRPIPNQISMELLKKIAFNTHGFVGADLSALVNEAGLHCIRQLVGREKSQYISCLIEKNELQISECNIIAALQVIKPSAMREISVEVPRVLWADIGGQEDIKQRLREAVEWPLLNPESFSRFHIQPPKGILLYGPPGCSKTLMAKALATESGLNFIAVKGPELFSKYVGESERAVREIFRKARQTSPSIIFFDEIDAVGLRRGMDQGRVSVQDRVLSQLLAEMDGIKTLTNVTIVAATNRPDALDEALLRPGRIDRILYVGPPDLPSRTEILRIRTNRMSIAEDVNVKQIATMMEGFSGAEVVHVCQEAGLLALEENLEAAYVAKRHFQAAIRKVTPQITMELLKSYKEYQVNCGLQTI